jgi:putative component of toxin-antitoxin plasmid stabilization module
VPFEQWLDDLNDQKAVARILARVDYGPGYRVYFGRDGRTLVVLLCGGDRRTQDRDIRLAKQYWREYK